VSSDPRDAELARGSLRLDPLREAVADGDRERGTGTHQPAADHESGPDFPARERNGGHGQHQEHDLE
jgi:hypothetical protein